VSGKSQLQILCKGKVVIDPVAGTGLTLDGCTNCTVEKLRVGGGAPFGILILDGHDNRLSKCRVEDSAQAGIRLDGGHNQTLEKCTVKGGADGIALGTGAASAVDDSLVTRCKVEKGSGLGISLNGSNDTVEQCQVLAAGGHAFAEDGSTVGVLNQFIQCKAVHPGGHGFVLVNDGASVASCRVVKSGQDAVEIASGSGALVQDCSFVHSLDDGVLIEAAGATLDHCKITGPAGDGIVIQADGVAVTDCKVSGAGAEGCSIFGSDATISKNKATGSGASGFRLQSGAAGNSLTHNKAKGSQDFDLFDDSGDPLANSYDGTNKFKTVGITMPP
jgi:parallel beta-helix repeat protein